MSADWYALTDSQGVKRHYRPDTPEGEALAALTNALKEVERLTAENEALFQEVGTKAAVITAYRVDRDALQARIDAALLSHQEADLRCVHDDFGWPCPTVVALTGDTP